MGGPIGGQQRISGTDMLLQEVGGTGENEQDLDGDVLRVGVAQGPFGVPAAAVGHPVLCSHVDFVPHASPPLHRAVDATSGRRRPQQHSPGESYSVLKWVITAASLLPHTVPKILQPSCSFKLNYMHF